MRAVRAAGRAVACGQNGVLYLTERAFFVSIRVRLIWSLASARRFLSSATSFAISARIFGMFVSTNTGLPITCGRSRH